jgi:hypothetical protein
VRSPEAGRQVRGAAGNASSLVASVSSEHSREPARARSARAAYRRNAGWTISFSPGCRPPCSTVGRCVNCLSTFPQSKQALQWLRKWKRPCDQWLLLGGAAGFDPPTSSASRKPEGARQRHARWWRPYHTATEAPVAHLRAGPIRERDGGRASAPRSCRSRRQPPTPLRRGGLRPQLGDR